MNFLLCSPRRAHSFLELWLGTCVQLVPMFVSQVLPTYPSLLLGIFMSLQTFLWLFAPPDYPPSSTPLLQISLIPINMSGFHHPVSPSFLFSQALGFESTKLFLLSSPHPTGSRWLKCVLSSSKCLRGLSLPSLSIWYRHRSGLVPCSWTTSLVALGHRPLPAPICPSPVSI